jgi:hypothetical protein
MPGVPPVLSQAKVIDFSFMEIKNLKGKCAAKHPSRSAADVYAFSD